MKMAKKDPTAVLSTRISETVAVQFKAMAEAQGLRPSVALAQLVEAHVLASMTQPPAPAPEFDPVNGFL